MKADILKILNRELARAQNELERARRNSDYVGIKAWDTYKTLVESLIKKIQDEG